MYKKKGVRVRMKVLWICNVPIPEAQEVMKQTAEVRVSWLVGISLALRKKTELYYAYPAYGCTQPEVGRGDNITFIAIPRRIKAAGKYDKEMKQEIEAVYEKIKPDVIHIFGTEFPHTYSAVLAAEAAGFLDRTVVSIQGLVSVCGTHYLASLPHKAARFYTLRDLLRRSNIYGAQKEFAYRAQFEKKALSLARHVIGRTDWDKACTRMMNPQIKYHFNNEILRNSFYEKKWSYANCEPYRIFMSQGGVPYKGLHFAVEALAMLKKRYPKIKLYVTERDFLHPKGYKEKLRLNSYQYLIKKMILRENLEEHVCFLGTLSEAQMCEQYLKANVYILPSAIENSPNSLGEAMLLGTPAVASDVGGVKNMMTHGAEGFVYPHDDPYMLAGYIDDIFLMGADAERFSDAERAHAAQIFDVEKNMEDLITIYRELYEASEKPVTEGTEGR